MQRGKHLPRSPASWCLPLGVTRTPLHCSGSTEASSRMVGKVNVSRVLADFIRGKKASAEPEQSPPPVMFSQQKGMMLQSRSPRRPPHPSTRRSRPAEVGHSSTSSSSVVSSSGTGTKLLPLWTLLFSQMFSFQPLPFFLFSQLFASSLPSTSGSDIASSFSLKCSPHPLPSLSIRTRISLGETA
ncbi:hypothetical protein GWK47_027846 [Chionoecetes opilio]|uniref:Uncharacterized protein n=1 Tax=Chionoecetes opilio TaxID=41210 RepID=A0A8J8WMK5_CHIOP|nr:hypothetical protein GWK47_027846 [Chionoecetes opilio]